jgi:hypothetical protein
MESAVKLVCKTCVINSDMKNGLYIQPELPGRRCEKGTQTATPLGIWCIDVNEDLRKGQTSVPEGIENIVTGP